jgi:hypothetical protein
MTSNFSSFMPTNPLHYGLCAGVGEMIVDVFLDRSTYASPPSR